MNIFIDRIKFVDQIYFVDSGILLGEVNGLEDYAAERRGRLPKEPAPDSIWEPMWDLHGIHMAPVGPLYGIPWGPFFWRRPGGQLFRTSSLEGNPPGTLPESSQNPPGTSRNPPGTSQNPPPYRTKSVKISRSVKLTFQPLN